MKRDPTVLILRLDYDLALDVSKNLVHYLENIFYPFRLHELQVTSERIISAVDSLPQQVKEWATSTFAVA
jgi:hypothetical protein